ncbi:MAG: GNAT family N-acetyltransferase [Cytophagales bacterium]|nr:GNAT family N-acetyltransferase [Armatimonadota bacterium]
MPALQTNPFVIYPVVLEGAHVRLEPLMPGHAAGLAAVSDDPALFQYMSFGNIGRPDLLRAWIESVAREPEAGTGVPFAIVDRAAGAVAGSTSYGDIAGKHRSLEIGRTWLGTAYQRTALNTEAKYLLLRHAFETLGANRVQIKTDSRNFKSQAAIERLGAIREGVLRAHMTLPDGFVRDTVMYSVIAGEWPRVKAGLEDRMNR